MVGMAPGQMVDWSPYGTRSPRTTAVVVDGSNIATEGRTLPSLAQLDEAIRAFLEEYPRLHHLRCHRGRRRHLRPPDRPVRGARLRPGGGARRDGHPAGRGHRPGRRVHPAHRREVGRARSCPTTRSRSSTPSSPGCSNRDGSSGASRCPAWAGSSPPHPGAGGEEPIGDGQVEAGARRPRRPDRGPRVRCRRIADGASGRDRPEAGRRRPPGPPRRPRRPKPTETAKGAQGHRQSRQAGKAAKASQGRQDHQGTKAAKATKTTKAGQGGQGGQGHQGRRATRGPPKATEAAKLAKAGKADKGHEGHAGQGGQDGQPPRPPRRPEGRPPGLRPAHPKTAAGRSSRGAHEALNEPMTFLTFVADHPVGSTFDGTVVSFTSHGAHVESTACSAMFPCGAWPIRRPRRPARCWPRVRPAPSCWSRWMPPAGGRSWRYPGVAAATSDDGSGIRPSGTVGGADILVRSCEPRTTCPTATPSSSSPSCCRSNPASRPPATGS